jgi:integrase
VTLAEARTKAREWRKSIRQGVDPKVAEQHARQAARAAQEAFREEQEREAKLGTVADLFGMYIRDLEQDGKRSAAFVKSLYERDIAPCIGHLKTSEITPDHCADIVTAIAERGALVLANRCRGYLVRAFNFGRRANRMPRWRKLAPEFGVATNPASEIEKALSHEPRGQRALSRDEVRQVWQALSEPYEAAAGQGARRMAKVDTATEVAIKLLIASGQRVEEVQHARWPEFDLEQMVWTISADRRKNARKNVSGEPHLVPLTQFHKQILDALEPRQSEFLFPSRPRKGVPNRPRDYRTLTQAVSRLCAREVIEPFSPRDIRRTVKTLMGSLGIDLEIRNRLQGHAFDDVGSRHYDRFDYLPQKRQAMENWTAALERWVCGSAVVVPFGSEARR